MKDIDTEKEITKDVNTSLPETENRIQTDRTESAATVARLQATNDSEAGPSAQN